MPDITKIQAKNDKATFPPTLTRSIVDYKLRNWMSKFNVFSTVDDNDTIWADGKNNAINSNSYVNAYIKRKGNIVTLSLFFKGTINSSATSTYYETISSLSIPYGFRPAVDTYNMGWNQSNGSTFPATRVFLAGATDATTRTPIKIWNNRPQDAYNSDQNVRLTYFTFDNYEQEEILLEALEG